MVIGKTINISFFPNSTDSLFLSLASVYKSPHPTTKLHKEKDRERKEETRKKKKRLKKQRNIMERVFFLGFLVFVFGILVEQRMILAENDGGFVKTSGVQLTLNGSPYYANGFNAYWLMFVASDPSQRNKITSAFQDATSHGLNIARTWAFSDGGYQPLQYSPGSYNENMFKVRLN